MIINSLKSIFIRDINKLKTEIELFQNEKNMWRIEKGISNSAGNLCLHLIGNLNAYIGVGLAKINYVRQRDLEFSLKDVPRVELIKKIEETILVVEDAFDKLTDEQMNGIFPIQIWDKPTDVTYTLIQLLTHLNYHLGQINSQRRLLD